jgi:hypothetical protein
MSTFSDSNQAILDFMRDDPLTIVYQQFLNGVYDPTTSELTTTPVLTSAMGLILDLTRNANGLSSKYGLMIVEGDKDCYMYPPYLLDGTQPQLVINTAADKMLVGTTLYRVVNCKTLDPSGSGALLYNFMLRR